MSDENLHSKRKRRFMSDDERVRDFQRKLYRKAKQERKSQRKCKLYKKNAFNVLRDKYSLIDPTKYFPLTPANV